MAYDSPGVPRIPNAPDAYSDEYFEQVWRVLRIWMTQIAAPSHEEIGETAIETTTATAVLVGLSGGTYLVDTTGGSVVVTLPAPNTVTGREFTVKRITAGANTLTVVGASGLVDGAASQAVAVQYRAYTFKSDGTNYWIVGYIP